MIDQACKEYLENPEEHTRHLDECAKCRAVFGSGGAPLEPRGVDVESLPMANWEGASNRAWALVGLTAFAIIIVALALAAMAGITPIGGAFAGLPPLEIVARFVSLAGGAMHNAPTGWHIAIGIAFVIVNSLLFLLLRRAPRGIDVSN